MIKKTAKESIERLIELKRQEYDDAETMLLYVGVHSYGPNEFDKNDLRRLREKAQNALLTMQVLNFVKVCLFEDIETLFEKPENQNEDIKKTT